MESKKKFRRRTINEYRQVKDSVYKHPHYSAPEKTNKYFRMFEEIKALCRSNGEDHALGGAIRRLIRRHNEFEQQRQDRTPGER